MSVSVSMPQLGESVTEGTVTRWLKKEGERVEADEPLLEVSTDKVDTEIPSPAAGVLREIAVGEDETVEVGAQLAVIEEGDGAASGGEAPSSDGDQRAQAQQDQQAPAQAEAPAQAQAQEAPAPSPQSSQAQGAQGDAGANGAAASAPAASAPAPAPAWSQPQQQAPPPAPAQAPAAAPPAASAPAPQAEAPAPPSTGSDGPYVTPLVRKLAAEHGVDLESVPSTD